MVSFIELQIMITTDVSIKIPKIQGQGTNNLTLILGLNIVVGFGRENNGKNA